MPFLLIFLAIIMLVSGFRGTTGELLTLLEGDFVSSQGFLPWALAVLAIGAVGYVPRVKPLSDAFLVLVIIVLLLKNGSFFSKLTTAYDSAGASAQQLSSAGTSTGTGATSTGGGLPSSVTSLLQSFTGGSSTNGNGDQIHEIIGGAGGAVTTNSNGVPYVPLGAGESLGGILGGLGVTQ